MIRRYREGDHLAIGEIYHQAVHRLACQDYRPEQLHAWAAPVTDRAAWARHWKKRCERKRPFVGEVDGEVAGFLELDPDGHIDCTYVHPDHARTGLMSRVMTEVKREAHARKLPRLFAEVSLTARPFFERHGFRWVRDNLVEIRGVTLRNYLMECPLAPGNEGGVDPPAPAP